MISNKWYDTLSKLSNLGESWGMANDGEWRTVQYLVDG